MPIHIKIFVSVLTTLAGAIYFLIENSYGEPRLAYVGGALAIFMVIAMWVFPETGGNKRS